MNKNPVNPVILSKKPRRRRLSSEGVYTYSNFLDFFKHSEIEGMEEQVKKALEDPYETRVSQDDIDVYLSLL